MNTSKSSHAKSQSPLGGPDNPEQHQLPTPATSPEKTPTGRLSYANSVTKNIFKSPTNPLKTAITSTGSLFRNINPGAVVFDLSHLPTTQDIIEDALLAIFEKFTPASVRGYRQVGAKGNAIEILFDPSVAAVHRKTATEQGITFKDYEPKAVSTESMKTRLTFVKLRNMPLFPSEEAIVRVLSQSMATFGKIRNVSIFKKPVGHVIPSPPSLTDHSMLSIGLEVASIKQGPGWWKLNTSILKEIKYKKTITDFLEFIFTSDGPFHYATRDRMTAEEYDSLKQMLRHLSLEYSIKRARENKKNEHHLQTQINQLSLPYNVQDDGMANTRIQSLLLQLDQTQKEKLEVQAVRARIK
ncbi:hypothetical protein K450DRAFT_263102 [Umbelopsis ramanniana AG]|uniref:Uncharacterized protein n=1 Tax=Umbelopsis ramanniana AG TaxID=1314678 RepID=A0AAD5E1G4_UMBRA|nr:uncharacterized protein K450DRAFT_263102 [Umbelopsis ramanniana AG]KAI8575164.1 hypothetical protein K450DRAFT_263102 [Umbelopsis ramanniana AG]